MRIHLFSNGVVSRGSQYSLLQSRSLTREGFISYSHSSVGQQDQERRASLLPVVNQNESMEHITRKMLAVEGWGCSDCCESPVLKYGEFCELVFKYDRYKKLNYITLQLSQ